MAEVRRKSSRGRFGVSRQQWLAAALDLLEERGIEALRIQTLAARLGVSKSGFYWHFRDRRELLDGLLNFWSDLEERPLLELGEDALGAPEQTLRSLGEVVDREHLSRYDAAIRQWAKSDDRVSEIYQAKLQRRLEFLRALFVELGFDGAESEMRARTFVGYVSMERELFSDQTAEERAALRVARLRMLLRR